MSGLAERLMIGWISERRKAMSVSDILSAISLVVAALAFVIAFLTFVYTVTMGPRLSMLIGEDIQLLYGSNLELVVVSDFTFFNGGAQPGALVELSGTITTSDGSKKAILRWTGIGESKNIAEPGKGSDIFISLGSLPQTIVVTGRGVSGAETEKIYLGTSEPFELFPTNYVLALKGLVGPKLTRWCKAKANLEISKDDVEFMRNHTVQDASTGVAETSLLLVRKELPKGNLISGLARSASPAFASLPGYTTPSPYMPTT
jgi:hypothetical protein